MDFVKKAYFPTPMYWLRTMSLLKLSELVDDTNPALPITRNMPYFPQFRVLSVMGSRGFCNRVKEREQQSKNEKNKLKYSYKVSPFLASPVSLHGVVFYVCLDPIVSNPHPPPYPRGGQGTRALCAWN